MSKEADSKQQQGVFVLLAMALTVIGVSGYDWRLGCCLAGAWFFALAWSLLIERRRRPKD